MTPEEFARDSWKGEGPDKPLPSIDELRGRADAFRRRIQRRNWIEYAAGALVILVFGAVMLFGPLFWLRVGAAIVIGGTGVVLWQLHQRGSPLTPAEHAGQLSLLEYQRRELIRQRDALDSIFSWYLLPLIPGMLVVMGTPWLETIGEELPMPPLDVIGSLTFPCVVFFLIYVVNKAAARKLQGKIDEIDALRES